MKNYKNGLNILGGSFAHKHIQNGFFYKEARGLGRRKLIEEINFLQHLPNQLKSYFPKIIDYSIKEDHVYLKEKHITFLNLRQHLFNGTLNVDQGLEVLDRILFTLSKYAYWKEPITPPNDYLDQFHYNRVWKRIEHTLKVAPIFKKIISAKKIIINGKSYLNIPQVILFLQSSSKIRDFLTPKSIYPFVHGDLHLENILVNPSNLSFKLVDPRGYPYCDINYDLGKINHSLNGKYDFIHEKLFSINWKAKNKNIISASFKFEKSKTFITYGKMNEKIVELYKSHAKDSNVLIKVLFNEAMHFSSDMPFHITYDGKEEKALALYFTGVKLLNEFLSLYDATFKLNLIQTISTTKQQRGNPSGTHKLNKLVSFYL